MLVVTSISDQWFFRQTDTDKNNTLLSVLLAYMVQMNERINEIAYFSVW